MKKSKKKIGYKVTALLLAAVCCAVLLTGSVSIGSLLSMKNLSAETSRELGSTAAEDAEAALEEQARVQLQILSQEKAAYINEKFAAVEASCHGIAALAEKIYDNPQDYPDREMAYPVADSHELAAQLLWSERLKEPSMEQTEERMKLSNVQDLLEQYNGQNDMVSSTYLATESGWLLQADYIAYSKYTNGGELPDFYEASSRQWYTLALKAGRGEIVYSDVIQDAHGGGDCIVCSQPVYHDGKIVGVAGVGFYLKTVNDVVLNTTVGETGYAFLVNQNGQVAVSPKTQGEMAAQAKTGADLRNSANQELRDAAENMMAGNTGLIRLNLDNQEVYLAYAPLPGLGWSFGTVMPVEEVIAPAKESQQMILNLTEEVAEKQDAAIKRMLVSLLAVIPVALAIVSLFGAAFSRKITNPLCRLTEDVAKLSSGDLDYQIKVATGDEVEDLGRAFNRMTAKLKEYILNLASATAEKERIRTELCVASRLQADMLPDPDNVLKDRKEFSIHTLMSPAKEVGGDFYDFFLLDQDHLALVVADVSGKGVSAALFMVVSRTMLRSSLSGGIPLAQTAEEVNNALCLDNKEGMFVTAWLGVLTLSTGVLTYVNAGHCHPLLTRNGKFEYLTDLGGMMLSGLEGSKYKESTIQLKQGDILYQCSDGVTEAHSENRDLYGEERLQQLLNDYKNNKPDSGPKQLIKAVWEDLEKFRGSADQFDDITMLAVCYHGGMADPSAEEKESGDYECMTMVQSPKLDKLAELTEHIKLSLRGKLSHDSMASVLIAVDEIYSNICKYSHASKVECTWQIEEGLAMLWFQDDGEAYNPLDKEDPDLEAELEDRDIGGLGIYLVKQQMDEMKYEYQNGKNCLTLIRREAL